MMTNHTVFIIGGSNESMNAAILLASLGKAVNFIAPQEDIGDTLTHYQFERQMVSLWELYVKEQKIRVLEGVLSQYASQLGTHHGTIWVFLDKITDGELAQLPAILTSPHQHILLSGFSQIGHAQQLAKLLASYWVFYLPFTFMKDGENFSSLLHPDVVLIGEKSANSYQKNDILLFFVQNANQHYLADIQTVEFARASMMTMLATRVSLMNELARLADQMGVNIKEVQAIMGLDRRIGNQFLAAGWGFGGRTLPLELGSIQAQFANTHLENPLITAVNRVNDDQKELLFRKFWQHFAGFIEQKTVVIWGAGYRAGTGRTTNSAIHPLLKLLWSYHIKTYIFATNTVFELKSLYANEPLFALVDDAYAMLSQADALMIVNWSPAITPDIHRLNQVAIPIFDGKNVLDGRLLLADYYGVGVEFCNKIRR